MRYLFILLFVFLLVGSSYAEVRDFKCVRVFSENVQKTDMRRMRAVVIVPDAYKISKQDLIDTGKAAALDLYNQSKMDVIVVKVYPSEGYSEFFPQMLDLTYAPNKVGWNGKPSAVWVGYIAEEMPSEKDMFRIETWIVEQAKNKHTLIDRKKSIAKKMGLPIDDVYFPIFNLVPCVMDSKS